MENPRLLEAAVVRCAQNRSETRYKAECVNARQAISIIEAREERERAAAFEKESQQKREALRRTQQAAAEARRRAQEARRLREEAEYLAQFGEQLPAESRSDAEAGSAGNAPVADLDAPGPAADEQTQFTGGQAAAESATDGGNAPAASSEPPADLDSIREELKRRAESENN